MVNEQSYNFLTSDDSIKNNKHYKEISSVLTNMVKCGVIDLGSGYCISIGDMVSSALKARGIDSKIVECQATITYHDCNPPDIRFIGFNNMSIPGEIDTHVVVVTTTDPPFMIDASIPHRLPRGSYAILEPIKTPQLTNNNLIKTKFDKHNISVLYDEKKLQHVPKNHQVSIIERVETDRKIFKNLSSLKLLVIIALTISGLNALRGTYDFYSVYILENSWGPRAIKSLDDRLDKIEDLLEKNTNK
jgi:hypothetical protein